MALAVKSNCKSDPINKSLGSRVKIMYPKGYKKIYNKKELVCTLQFDKNGQLCNMFPRIGDLLNMYRGQTRLCISKLIPKILEATKK